MNEFDSYILIGGRSSRLGRDKARVEIGGRTLLQRAVDTVRGAFEPTRVTAVATNEAQFGIEAIIADARFMFDLHENRGPLGGLHSALADANTPWIFVMACDYPFVSAGLIGLLKENVSEEFGCVVPEQNDGQLQALCGFYKVERARPIIEEIIEKPRVSPPMREVARLLDPRIIGFDQYAHLPDANDLFVNINTIEDLNRALLKVRM